MIFILFGALLLVGLLFPHFWIAHVMKKYGKEDATIPGTGGELAQHLIDRFELDAVTVEKGASGQDHYRPDDRVVSLSPQHFDRKSLAAIAVSAHEVGHAIQFTRNEPVTRLGKRYTPLARIIERIAIGFVFAAPLVFALVKVPHAALITAFFGVQGMLMSVVLQLIILPLEWDASFNKALPILKEGGYIQADQEAAVRSLLKAAALTYVAAALADILRLWRWWAIFRGALR